MSLAYLEFDPDPPTKYVVIIFMVVVGLMVFYRIIKLIQ